MAEKTNIPWCRSTFNCWIGCSNIGPGCDHCYAEVQDSRKRWGGTTHWGAGVPRYRTSPANWAQPLMWNRKAAASGKPWRVFCASLGDVFDNEVPQEWRSDLWRLIEATPHLSWLLVTKRIGNVARMVPSLDWLAFHDNVRIIATICNQEEAERDIPKLLALPCKNGVSYEPALGPVDWSPWLSRRVKGSPKLQVLSALEWMIIGGESGQSGHKARPFDLSWARSTVAQCKTAGVSCFVKQMGAAPIVMGGEFTIGGKVIDPPQPFRVHFIKDRAGADPSEWPVDLRIREYPE